MEAVLFNMGDSIHDICQRIVGKPVILFDFPGIWNLKSGIILITPAAHTYKVNLHALNIKPADHIVVW